MTIQILSRRSSLLYDRPVPTRIGLGELCININATDPGLFFAVCEILLLDCRLARTRNLGSGCVAGQCG